MSIVNFADMKQGGLKEIERLNEEAAKFNTKYERDERYWQPATDKGGDGSATIRFLPSPPGEDVPFVRMFSYGFDINKRWYIENSPQTHGLPDPVGEHWEALMNAGDKEAAKKFSRRLHFISNIYVVRNKLRPQDEGKVFLYKFGTKIWNKLQSKMNPDDEDRARMNPFDLWKGANFFLKTKRVSSFPNYDDSEFDMPSPLSSDDGELERIWKQCYSLKAEVAQDKFKPYAELKKKLDWCLGKADPYEKGGSTQQARSVRQDDGDNGGDNRPSQDDGGAPFGGDSGDDSDMAWLKELANKD